MGVENAENRNTSLKENYKFLNGACRNGSVVEGNVKPESEMTTNETIRLIIGGLIIFTYK